MDYIQSLESRIKRIAAKKYKPRSAKGINYQSQKTSFINSDTLIQYWATEEV